MNNREQIETAEAKMNAAKDALLKYTEQQATIDHDRYRQLVSRLKKAEAEFLQALSESGR